MYRIVAYILVQFHQIFPPKWYPGDILKKTAFPDIDKALDDVMRAGDLMHDRRCAVGVANVGGAKLDNPRLAFYSGQTHSAPAYEISPGETGLNLFIKLNGTCMLSLLLLFSVADPGGGGGPGGLDPPPFVPRCRLFNIGPKIGPPSGPPFFAYRPNLDPPPLSKILDPPQVLVVVVIVIFIVIINSIIILSLMFSLESYCYQQLAYLYYIASLY